MITRALATSLLLLMLCSLRCGSLIGISSAQTPAPTVQPSPASGSETQASPLMPGISISLYVNSADKEHFETVLKRAIYLRDTDPRVRLTSVFHIGDYRNVSPEVEEALRKRAIYFSGIVSTPKSIAASTSPTWVIRTPSSDHIIEGPIPIEDCFDRVGGYQEPRARRSRVAASPTARVKEF
jgi:hypothetical protein